MIFIEVNAYEMCIRICSGKYNQRMTCPATKLSKCEWSWIRNFEPLKEAIVLIECGFNSLKNVSVYVMRSSMDMNYFREKLARRMQIMSWRFLMIPSGTVKPFIIIENANCSPSRVVTYPERQLTLFIDPVFAITCCWANDFNMRFFKVPVWPGRAREARKYTLFGDLCIAESNNVCW